MKLKSFEQALNHAPFVPFLIRIDGKSIPVEHPDQVLFNHDRTTVVVAPRDNRFHILDVDRIQFVTLQARKKASK